MRFSEFNPLNEAAPYTIPVPTDKSSIELLQKALAAFEFNVTPTGTIDDLTSTALSNIQKEAGLPITGQPDAGTINAVNTALLGAPDIADNLKSGVTKLSKSKTEPTSFDNVGAKTASAKGSAVIIGNEKRTGGSISWRTNNPGNVQYGPKAKSFGAIGSAIASDGEPVAIMPTLEHGWKMQIALWRTPRYNNGTINQGCRTWAKAVGDYKGIHPYTIALADAVGASVHTKVSELSDEQLKNMVKRQAKLEGFKVGTVTTV
jgi:Putative peptidoglycan binding domain